MSHVTQCILHFGMPKTGSTSIQESLSSGLADPDFFYPDLGHPNHGVALSAAFCERPERYHANRKRGIGRKRLLSERPAVLQQLAGEIGRSGRRTMILSAEDVLHLSTRETADVSAFFAGQSCRLQLVAYVRPIRGWVESRFAQTRVEPRPNLPKDLWAWVEEWKTERPHIQAKDDVFGHDNVTLWPFVPAHFPRGCVVQDFCRRIGVNAVPEAIHRFNERLTLPAVRFLHAYRQYGPGYGVGPRVMNENANLLRHLGMLTGPRFHFHSEMLDAFCRRNEADIAWMESRVGGSLRDEMGQDKDEHAIRVESDLLAFSMESLEWLAERTGISFRRLAHGDPSEVAATLHLLRGMPFNRETRGRSAGLGGSMVANMRQRAHAMLSLARRRFRR